MPPPELSEAERALVECLRVFARRGRALRKADKSKAVNAQPLAGETLTADGKDPVAKESIHEDFTRIPYADQLRANVETVIRWQDKKPQSTLRRLIAGLQRLIEKYGCK